MTLLLGFAQCVDAETAVIPSEVRDLLLPALPRKTGRRRRHQVGLVSKRVGAGVARSDGGVLASNTYVVPTADWLTRSP